MPDLQPVYDELVRRMATVEPDFRVTDNTTDANRAGGRKEPRRPEDPESYLLLGAPTEKYPDGLAFGGVRLGKRYVSYHLMCTYFDPDMVGELSEKLRKRMQGKSCFNFTRVDDELFDELEALTRRGRDQYAAQGLLATDA